MVSILYKWSILCSLLFAVPTHFNTAGDPAYLHPIFVSVTEIEHNAAQKTLELSCKLFTDDLEKTLRMHTIEKIDLLNGLVKKQMEKLVNNYIQQHLQIRVDGKVVALQFIGFEQQEEGIVSFYQAGNVPLVKRFDIFNNLLYEYKTEQMGIMHVMVNGIRKSSKLNNPDTELSFTF